MRNLRLKIILWLFVIFPVVGIILAFIISELELISPDVTPELELDKSFLGRILAGTTYGFWVLLTLFKVTSVRCPKCNSTIYPLTKIFFSFEFPRKKCRNCGCDLRGRDSEKEVRMM